MDPQKMAPDVFSERKTTPHEIKLRGSEKIPLLMVTCL